MIFNYFVSLVLWQKVKVAFYVCLFFDTVYYSFSLKMKICTYSSKFKSYQRELRWWRNRTGRPLSPPQIHRKIIWTLSKLHKQLLIASRGHQTPRKTVHCLWNEVGQNIKDKKRDNRVRDGGLSQEGSLNRGSFQTPGNPLTGGSGGSFWISEGNLTGRKNK